MNKIIDSKKNILKICAGNDFSIVVQITEYDTETGAWVNYDLSAVNDVHMTLVAENGKHIKLPVVVNEDGTVSAPVQAAYLQKSTYGIELTWVTNDLNRRTYSPCLMQIVTTTAESTSNIAEYESNDAYHFNIKMEADVAILSIGKISDEYITEDELDTTLENYVTNSSLSTTLDDYATISSLDDYATKQYVDDELANIDLTDYYTKSEVDTTLNSYGTSLSSHTQLIPGPSVGMDISLNNSDAQPLSTLTIPSFQKNINSSSPKGWVISPDTSIGFVSKSIVETIYDTVDDVNGIMSDYITSTSLNSTLSDYATKSFLATVLNDYVTNTSLNSTLSDYVTNSSLSTTLNNYVTNSALSSTLANYASVSDVAALDTRVTALENAGSGVLQEDWDNANEAIAQELLDNRLEHLSINNNFSNYYTKTESDGRYATASWANSRFVTQADDINRQQAIAAAFASSIQSTSVHNIWTGSQNDYDAITTKDTNTLYIIL